MKWREQLLAAGAIPPRRACAFDYRLQSMVLALNGQVIEGAVIVAALILLVVLLRDA